MVAIQIIVDFGHFHVFLLFFLFGLNSNHNVCIQIIVFDENHIVFLFKSYSNHSGLRFADSLLRFADSFPIQIIVDVCNEIIVSFVMIFDPIDWLIVDPRRLIYGHSFCVLGGIGRYPARTQIVFNHVQIIFKS